MKWKSWRHGYDISSCRQYAIQSWRLQDDDIMATYIRHIILQAVCNSKSTTPRWRHRGDMYTTYHIAGSMQFKVGDSRMKTSWRHLYDTSSCRQYAIQSRRLQDEDSLATCIRQIILHAVCNSKTATPRWRNHGDMYTTYHLAGSMQFKNGDSKMKTSWRHIYDIPYCRQYAVQSRRLQHKDIMASTTNPAGGISLYIFVRCDFREQGPFFSKMMTKALRKCENVMQNACGRTHNGKQSIQRGCINKNYTLFPAILQIPGAIKSPKIGVVRAIGGPGKLFRAWFCLNAIFKIMLPNEGGKLFFKKSDN